MYSYIAPAASSAAAALMLHTYGCLSLNLPQQLFSVTLGSGGQKTMESAAASQATNKGCKVNRRAASRQRQSAAATTTTRDESGGRAAHNGVKESQSAAAMSSGISNCSDEENNEDNSSSSSGSSNVAVSNAAVVSKANAVNSSSSNNNKKNAKSTNSNTTSSTVSNNSSNTKNSNRVSIGSKVAAAPAAAAAVTTTNDAKVVSNKVASTENNRVVGSSDSSKAATNDVGCSNVKVANNRHTSNEFHSSSRSNGHGRSSKGNHNGSSNRSSAATTTQAAANDLSKVVSSSKPVTNELSYSKVTSSSSSSSYKTPKNEMSYSDIVSSSSNGNGNGNNKSNGYESGNAYKVSNDHHSAKVSSNGISRHSTNNNAVVNGHNKREAVGNQQQQQHHNNKVAAVVATNNSINSSMSPPAADGKLQAKSKTAAIDPEAQQRRAVLSYEQVCRLNDVMNEVVSIHGRGNFPTLEVKLRDLVSVVRAKLEADPSSGGAGMKVRDIRLNGGAASHVLATESQPYNDLDLIFGVELGSGRNYDKIKAAVLSSLYELLPEGVSRTRITTCSLKEAYVSKMVKVNSGEGDRWSLISLGNSRGHRNVELKFVDSMRRQFEFSVDSFQIVLDALLTCEASRRPEQLNEADCPSVVGESVYGDFHEALYHLQKKLISTRHPEEIRGGGLLKYCNLLVKMYKAAQPDYIKTLERYMCSRFFIDFPDIGQQKAKLENYLWNHFVGPEEEALKYQYLMLLHSVVEESTVCLMGHERRQTLALIDGLAYQVLCQEQQQRLQQHHHQQQQQQQTAASHQAPPPAAYVYANGYYYAPVIPACYTCTCNSWMACSS